jgi:predicted ATP-grasp superfamily ATP-dependent carboligase
MKNFSGDLGDRGAQLQVAALSRQQAHYTRPEPRQLTYDALVLDAILRQSLATVRSLGSRGLRVAALGTSDELPTFSSRWCQQAFICPADEGTDQYLHYLEQVLDCTSARVLITSSDGTIALMRRYRERLDRRVRMALANEPALGIAVSKDRTLEIAKRLGLRVPRAVSVRNVSEIEAALLEIGLPAVVKPAQSWAWNGQQGVRLACEVVTTPDEARRAVEELVHFGGTVLLQQFVSGRRESISFLYAHSQVYARYAQWHTHISGGQSSLRRSIAIPPDIGDQAERLIREIELEGCSEVEFRRDATGNAYLMEINPRLWASTEHAIRSGIDFPYLLYQWATGDKISRVKSYRVGVWSRYLRGDITVTRAALKRRRGPGAASPVRAICEFCFAFFVPMKYDYVDWRDPLPAWKATVGYFHAILHKVGKRLIRKA